jgi:hypothetical protein
MNMCAKMRILWLQTNQSLKVVNQQDSAMKAESNKLLNKSRKLAAKVERDMSKNQNESK